MKIAGGFLIVCLLLGTTVLCSQEIPDQLEHLDKYLHKNARLGMNLVPARPVGEEAALTGRFVLTAREAAAFAVYHLRKMGVKDILICESHWIAAPLSGYVVDALGNHVIGGKRFTVFRIGIRDGEEDVSPREGQYQAGTPFVFIALGWDAAGAPVWYPACGPDYHLAADGSVPEGALSYEFLFPGEGRRAFEGLPRRYQ